MKNQTARRAGMVLLVGTLWLAARVVAQTEEKPPSRDLVEMEVRFVQTTDAAMRQAMHASGDIKGRVLNAEQYGRMLATLDGGKVKVLGALRAAGMSGKETNISSVRELGYPTEYQYPKSGAGKAFASVFETRNIGCEVVAVPTSDGDGKLDLKLELRHTDFLGFVDYTEAQAGKGKLNETTLDALLKTPVKEGGVCRPVVLKSVVDTTVELTSGQTVLLGGTERVLAIADPKDDMTVAKETKADEERVYMFVTARTLSRK